MKVAIETCLLKHKFCPTMIVITSVICQKDVKLDTWAFCWSKNWNSERMEHWVAPITFKRLQFHSFVFSTDVKRILNISLFEKLSILKGVMFENVWKLTEMYLIATNLTKPNQNFEPRMSHKKKVLLYFSQFCWPFCQSQNCLLQFYDSLGHFQKTALSSIRPWIIWKSDFYVFTKLALSFSSI